MSVCHSANVSSKRCVPASPVPAESGAEHLAPMLPHCFADVQAFHTNDGLLVMGDVCVTHALAAWNIFFLALKFLKTAPWQKLLNGAGSTRMHAPAEEPSSLSRCCVGCIGWSAQPRVRPREGLQTSQRCCRGSLGQLSIENVMGNHVSQGSTVVHWPQCQQTACHVQVIQLGSCNFCHSIFNLSCMLCNIGIPTATHCNSLQHSFKSTELCSRLYISVSTIKIEAGTVGVLEQLMSCML